jgi:farnesyl-diphosphate farnesyltransferase
MDMKQYALKTLYETSRTFFIPIRGLPDGLQEAVMSAYLCMRAIDEVEDHPQLDKSLKAEILSIMSLSLQSATATTTKEELEQHIEPYRELIPEVSYHLADWALLAPVTIAGRVWDATASMADRMAYWATKNWEINHKAELDQYTFSVAGSVGLLLSDLWGWYDNTQTSRELAIGFGRGLQAVNILRNHKEDKIRGVSFFPENWEWEDMFNYAQYNLNLADAYTKSLPKGAVLNFCQIPLTLAHATLQAMKLGQGKLTRSQVMALLAKIPS